MSYVNSNSFTSSFPVFFIFFPLFFHSLLHETWDFEDADDRGDGNKLPHLLSVVGGKHCVSPLSMLLAAGFVFFKNSIIKA